MNCYKADPVSREDIRRYVRDLKRSVGLENVLYFPILQFVENVLPLIIPDFQFEVVPEIEMGGKHGETYPSKNLMRIREDIYLRAAAGEGRDRFTIAHEVGHLFCTRQIVQHTKRRCPGDPRQVLDLFSGRFFCPDKRRPMERAGNESRPISRKSFQTTKKLLIPARGK